MTHTAVRLSTFNFVMSYCTLCEEDKQKIMGKGKPHSQGFCWPWLQDEICEWPGNEARDRMCHRVVFV